MNPKCFVSGMMIPRKSALAVQVSWNELHVFCVGDDEARAPIVEVRPAVVPRAKLLGGAEIVRSEPDVLCVATPAMVV